MRVIGIAWLMLFMLFPATVYAGGKRVALVIGNSEYKHSSRLNNPVNDAREIAASFKRLGFDSVVVKYNLNYTSLRRTLAAFSRTATGADLAVVYYSGHGIEIGGQNYLLPVDAKLNHAEDIAFEATSLSTVMASLERAGDLRLVILDACRDNPFRSRMTSSGLTRSVRKGLAPVAPQRNTLVAYASKDGTVAYDGDGPLSPYTASLLKHMETPDVEIVYLFRLVQESVLTETGGRQQPFIYGSLSSNRVYLKLGDRSNCKAAEQTWSYLKDTLSRGPLERFISQNPKCPQAVLAQRRIKNLTLAARPVVQPNKRMSQLDQMIASLKRNRTDKPQIEARQKLIKARQRAGLAFPRAWITALKPSHADQPNKLQDLIDPRTQKPWMMKASLKRSAMVEIDLGSEKPVPFAGVVIVTPERDDHAGIYVDLQVSVDVNGNTWQSYLAETLKPKENSLKLTAAARYARRVRLVFHKIGPASRKPFSISEIELLGE